MFRIGLAFIVVTGLLAVFGLVSYIGITLFEDEKSFEYDNSRIAGLLWFFCWGFVSLVISLGIFEV